MKPLVCRQAQRGSTTASIAIFSFVFLCMLVFDWPFSCEPSSPAAVKRHVRALTTGTWWIPLTSKPAVRDVDGMRHLSEMREDALDKLVVGRLGTGDAEFNESRILELMKPSNITFAPCQRLNLLRLRTAYVNIVPNFHDTSKDFSIQEEQLRRRKALSDTCRGEKITRPDVRLTQAERKSVLEHVLVNDKKKILYCYVPKVGCSNWKKVLKVLSGRDAWPGCLPFNHATDAVPLSTYTKRQKIYRLKNYYKFMFVRDPLARLVSAYIDKFHPNGTDQTYYKYYGRLITRKYRTPKPSNDTIVHGDDVTWKEFVDYVIGLKKGDFLNEHWAPYDHLCQPCLINYDFVGHYEQMTDEANYVLRQVKAHDVVAFPGRQGFYHTSSRDRVMSLFRTLNSSTQQRVMDIYDSSYRLFGYQKPIM